MKKFLSIAVCIVMTAVFLCACGSNAKPLSDIFADIKAKYDLGEMVEFTSADDLNRFYGIDAAQVEEYAGGINNTGVNQEEIVLVKAANADAAKSVETALSNRLNAKLNETKSYNPEQYDIVEDCEVRTDGNYVSLIISKDAEDMTAIYKSGIGVK